MFPRARRDDLTVRILPDETLIFDKATNKAHCLNQAAALVWQHCDGNTSVAALADMLQQQTQLPRDEGIVQLALAQLARRNLLEDAGNLTVGATNMSRRELLRKGAVALVALPIIMSLTAPKASAASSIFGACRGPCIRNEDCWANNPVGVCNCNFGLCSST